MAEPELPKFVQLSPQEALERLKRAAKPQTEEKPAIPALPAEVEAATKQKTTSSPIGGAPLTVPPTPEEEKAKKAKEQAEQEQRENVAAAEQRAKEAAEKAAKIAAEQKAEAEAAVKALLAAKAAQAKLTDILRGELAGKSLSERGYKVVKFEAGEGEATSKRAANLEKLYVLNLDLVKNLQASLTANFPGRESEVAAIMEDLKGRMNSKGNPVWSENGKPKGPGVLEKGTRYIYTMTGDKDGENWVVEKVWPRGLFNKDELTQKEFNTALQITMGVTAQQAGALVATLGGSPKQLMDVYNDAIVKTFAGKPSTAEIATRYWNDGVEEVGVKVSEIAEAAKGNEEIRKAIPLEEIRKAISLREFEVVIEKLIKATDDGKTVQVDIQPPPLSIIDPAALLAVR